MKQGFSIFPHWPVATDDGRVFVLLKDITYVCRDGVTQYILPAGATSDGASTPPAIWPTFPPFGSYWPAAFAHDCAYRNTLLGPNRLPAFLSKQQCDNLLLEIMEFLGTHEFTRNAIYEGVCLGGNSSFESDQAQGPAAFMDLVTLAKLAAT